jgi:hypothetical protein
MLQHALVHAELTACPKEVDLAEKILANPEQVEVIMVLDVTFPVDLFPVPEPFIGQVITGVQSFEQYRMIILQQAFKHFRRPPAGYDIRLDAEGGNHTGFPGVIMYFFTIPVELIRSAAPRIFYAMKVYLNPFFVKHFDLVEYVDHPTVIGWIGYIE